MKPTSRLLVSSVAALVALAGVPECLAQSVRCALHDVILQHNSVNFDGVATCDSGPARIRAKFTSEWQQVRSRDALEIDVHLVPGHTYAIDADRIHAGVPVQDEPGPTTDGIAWGLTVVEDSSRLVGFVANRYGAIVLVDFPDPRVLIDRFLRDGSRVTARLSKRRSVPYGGITLRVGLWSSEGHAIGEARDVRIDVLMQPKPMEIDIAFEIPGAIPADVAAITVQVIDREVLTKKEYRRRRSMSESTARATVSTSG